MLSSLIVTYFVTEDTVSEYINTPTRILVNSTNTPLNPEDFPAVYVCNINMVSKAKVVQREMQGINGTEGRNTVAASKEV